MRTITLSALVFGVGCLGVTALGCGSGQGSGPRPGVDQLPQGLTVFSSSETQINGAFKSGTTAIYFETRRGQPTLPGFKELMPDVGDYEMDARFLDAAGNTIMIQRGGDTFVEPSWGAELEKQNAQKTGIRLDVGALELAQQMTTAVVRQLPSAADHLHALTGLSEASVTRASTLRTAPTGGVQLQGTNWCNWNMANGQNASDNSCNWTWSGTSTYRIHYACIMSIIWCVGDHSSVEVDGNGFVLYSCNHGRCAYQMGNVSCQGTGSADDEQVEGATDYNTVTNACTTPYNWNSGGGTHNCHDDSMMECYGVKYGWQSSTGGVCQGLNWWLAPGDGHSCP
jgi:hypothetical protein